MVDEHLEIGTVSLEGEGQPSFLPAPVQRRPYLLGYVFLVRPVTRNDQLVTLGLAENLAEISVVTVLFTYRTFQGNTLRSEWHRRGQSHPHSYRT